MIGAVAGDEGLFEAVCARVARQRPHLDRDLLALCLVLVPVTVAACLATLGG